MHESQKNNSFKLGDDYFTAKKELNKIQTHKKN
jgi:hypothetical protein